MILGNILNTILLYNDGSYLLRARNINPSDIDWDKHILNFGVTDNIEQIKEKYKFILECDNQFVISVTKIVKAEQSKNDGWRFSRWGEYIGTQEIKSDYIYDCDNIDHVYVYHIYPIRMKV